MKILPAMFVNPVQDILSGSFESYLPPNEYISDSLLDPGLILQPLKNGGYGIPAAAIARSVTRMGLNSVLKLQQFLVFDIASTVGVLGPYVAPTTKALQAFGLLIESMDEDVIASEIITQAIGACGQVLSAVPTIYTQIAGAILSLGAQLASWFIGTELAMPDGLIPVQQYSEETDSYQFNHNFRTVTREVMDWTSIFSPRYSGDLSMQIHQDDSDRYVWVWGLGDGQVPQVTTDKSESDRFTEDGTFNITGGMGMIPGGERIYSLFQSTLLEKAHGYTGNHPTVYDPRCGSIGKVVSNDVGNFYPTSAQAGTSLWDFIFQRGAACYTVNPFSLSERWGQYFNSIWAGLEKFWGNPSWHGWGGDAGKGGLVGWGLGPWENSLQELAANYSVGAFGDIGGIGSFMPKGCEKHLTDADADAWNKSNVFYSIILPALSKLVLAQQWYLDNTTIAAYLPVYGGVDADPEQQERVMGAFAGDSGGTKNMRKRFVDARKRILNGSQKYEVRLDDVLDPTYRNQIEQKGGGTQGIGSFTSTPAITLAQLVWTPTGGPGKPPQRTPSPVPLQFDIRHVAGAAVGAAAAGAAAWYFHDDIRRFVHGLRRRLPRRR